MHSCQYCNRQITTHDRNPAGFECGAGNVVSGHQSPVNFAGILREQIQCNSAQTVAGAKIDGNGGAEGSTINCIVVAGGSLK